MQRTKTLVVRMEPWEAVSFRERVTFVPLATQPLGKRSREDRTTLEQLPGGKEQGLLLAEQDPEEKRKHKVSRDAGKPLKGQTGSVAEGDNMEVAENHGWISSPLWGTNK
jgi:hypothetical protein